MDSIGPAVNFSNSWRNRESGPNWTTWLCNLKAGGLNRLVNDRISRRLSQSGRRNHDGNKILLKSHPKPLGTIKMDNMEGVGLTGPCLWLGLLAVSRSLSPKFNNIWNLDTWIMWITLMQAHGRFTSHVDTLSISCRGPLKYSFANKD
jgi:hypothetical protein